MTDRDHAEALARIEAIFAAKPGTPEFDELTELATLVEAYEREHHPMSKLQAARNMEADLVPPVNPVDEPVPRCGRDAKVGIWKPQPAGRRFLVPGDGRSPGMCLDHRARAAHLRP